MNPETEKFQILSMDELIGLFQELLVSEHHIRFSPKGTSMLPMLRQGIDSVVLSPLTGPLKKYDLPLYQRADGKYILHRIVHAGKTYTCIGDNQFSLETGVRQEQILAVVTGFYRRETYHSVEEPAYRLYCCLWHHSRPVRKFILRCINWLRRKFK